MSFINIDPEQIFTNNIDISKINKYICKSKNKYIPNFLNNNKHLIFLPFILENNANWVFDFIINNNLLDIIKKYYKFNISKNNNPKIVNYVLENNLFNIYGAAYNNNDTIVDILLKNDDNILWYDIINNNNNNKIINYFIKYHHENIINIPYIDSNFSNTNNNLLLFLENNKININSDNLNIDSYVINYIYFNNNISSFNENKIAVNYLLDNTYKINQTYFCCNNNIDAIKYCFNKY